jgi:hypothetical protein
MTEAAEPHGVVFPLTGVGRSTSALGRAVVADALRAADPIGARAAENETSWRREYRLHFRRLVEAALPSPEAAVAIAHAGLSSVYERMRFSTVDDEVSLGEAPQLPVAEALRTATIQGTGRPEEELVLPYKGAHLRGHEVVARLDGWVEQGVVEPSCATAIKLVAENPQWLRLPGQTVAILGAGAEMSPLTALLRWGADVVAVDLPRPPVWQRLAGIARQHGGRLRAPVADRYDLSAGTGVGADLLHDVSRVAAWLSDVDGHLVVGNYAYADGAVHVRVTAAVDALTQYLLSRRADIGLAFLATPTDVFAVPAEAAAEANRRYAEAAGIGRIRRPLRILSGGALLARNYPPGADPGINDSFIPQQGPNYALAKRIQRWRATQARAGGAWVSLRVAPATRTRSVVKNRLLAAAFAGAHRFGIEIFDPATSNTLMAAMLVHDLCVNPPPKAHPWQDEADGAAHGGLWRVPYAPRSVLGIAVLLGAGAARG